MAELDPPGETEAPEGKGKLRLLMILPLALLAMVAGGFVTFSQYPTVSRVMHRPPAPETEAEAPIEYGFFHQFDGVTINPAGTGGARYLMLNIGMEAAKEATLEELKSREIVVRDTIIKLLSQRTVEELAVVEARTGLKDEVRDAVNGILRKGQIDRVYFTQYVLQ